MKNVLFISLLISIAITQQRSSYSWEDGTGTILGSYNTGGNVVVDEANVGTTSGISPYDGSRMLTVSESPIGGTPQAFIAWVTDLSAGQDIEACFYGHDESPGVKPSLRIWGSWSANDDIEEYKGTADGGSTYTNDDDNPSDSNGWSQVCYTFSTNHANWESGEALVIQARLYSEDGEDPTVYFIDLVEVTAPGSVTVNYPGNASGCTDATGCNYNPFASDDDGSCVYPVGSISIYDIQYTTDQGDWCYESEYDQECWTTSGTVTAKHPTYSNFYIQDARCNLGDLNGDGGWNILDIVSLANCVLAQNCASCAGDLNGDGGWNVLDIVALANCVLSGDCESTDPLESYSGIYVHGFSSTLPTIGDNITITATVNEYYSLTQLIDGASFSINSSGISIQPTDISTSDLANGCTATGESLESMLVRISNVSVTQTIQDEWLEWSVSDGSGSVILDDKIFDGEWPDPSLGQEYTSIVGVVDWYNPNWKILPRTMSDIGLSQTQPVADAGDDQFVLPGAVVTLDGSGTYDPDGFILAQEWTQMSGTSVNLDDEEAEITTFTAPGTNGDLVFRLTVYDNDFNEATDEITISVGYGDSIYDIQYTDDQGNYCYESEMDGETVTVTGIITAVESVYPSFFVQDFNFDTYGGIYARSYQNTIPGEWSPVIGDEVTVSGTVTEYYSFTQLEPLTSYTVNSEGNNLEIKDISTGDLYSDPLDTSTDQYCSETGEAVEGMLVRISNVTVVKEANTYGEWYVDDGSGPCIIDDGTQTSPLYTGSWISPNNGDTFDSIVGVVTYGYGRFRILPRDSNDFE